MLKGLFEKKVSESPKRKDVKAADKPMDATQLLGSAQTSLQRLRVMQPSDPEAFPMVNEATRYVQKLEIEVQRLSGTDEHPLWRLQLDELRTDLSGITQRIISSADIPDMDAPTRTGTPPLPARAASPVTAATAAAAAATAGFGGLDDDLFSGLSIAEAPATFAPPPPSVASYGRTGSPTLRTGQVPLQPSNSVTTSRPVSPAPTQSHTTLDASVGLQGRVHGHQQQPEQQQQPSLQPDAVLGSGLGMGVTCIGGGGATRVSSSAGSAAAGVLPLDESLFCDTTAAAAVMPPQTLGGSGAGAATDAAPAASQQQQAIDQHAPTAAAAAAAAPLADNCGLTELTAAAHPETHQQSLSSLDDEQQQQQLDSNSTLNHALSTASSSANSSWLGPGNASSIDATVGGSNVSTAVAAAAAAASRSKRKTNKVRVGYGISEDSAEGVDLSAAALQHHEQSAAFAATAGSSASMQAAASGGALTAVGGSRNSTRISYDKDPLAPYPVPPLVTNTVTHGLQHASSAAVVLPAAAVERPAAAAAVTTAASSGSGTLSSAASGLGSFAAAALAALGLGGGSTTSSAAQTPRASSSGGSIPATKDAGDCTAHHPVDTSPPPQQQLAQQRTGPIVTAAQQQHMQRPQQQLAPSAAYASLADAYAASGSTTTTSAAETPAQTLACGAAAAAAAAGTPVPVSLHALNDFLSQLTSGPSAHRAHAAEAYQQQLLSALSTQAAAVTKQERQLATQRRQLSAQLAQLTGQRRGELEQQQAAAVEAEDFDAAAAIDVQLQDLVEGQSRLSERVSKLEQQLVQCWQARVELVMLRGQVLERLAEFFKQLQQQRQAEVVTANQAAVETSEEAGKDAAAAAAAVTAAKQALEAKQAALEREQVALATKLDAVKAPAVEEKEQLRQQQQELQAEVDALHALLAEKQQQLAAATEAVAAADAKIVSLAGQYASEEAELAAAAADVADQTAELAAVEAAAASAAATAEAAQLAVEEQQTALHAEIGHLQDMARQRAAAAAAAAASVAAELQALDLLSALKAADADAQEKLRDLMKCIGDVAAQVQDAHAKRARLAAERAAADERAAAITARLPEIETEKKAAAAKKDFKEAARLSAEAKALTVAGDAAAEEARLLAGQLAALEAQEAGQAEELRELEAMRQEVAREAAVASWRRLTARCHLIRTQLAATIDGALQPGLEVGLALLADVAGDSEAVQALQADLEVEQAAADALASRWGGFSEQERHIEGLPAVQQVPAAAAAAVKDTTPAIAEVAKGKPEPAASGKELAPPLVAAAEAEHGGEPLVLPASVHDKSPAAAAKAEVQGSLHVVTAAELVEEAASSGAAAAAQPGCDSATVDPDGQPDLTVSCTDSAHPVGEARVDGDA